MANLPAVSVIIPLYNVEKYVGECLDSLLNQTFQYFEVIVVNDCSPDNSRQIVESYIPKFGGRLKLYDNEVNSGAAVSRNNGLLKASGEYVFFMDSDDLLLLNGLEEMYAIAKKYDADLLHLTAVYYMSENGKELTFNRKIPNTVPKLTVEEDLQRQIQRLTHEWVVWTPWRKFVKKDFLLANELFFPENITVSEDRIWTYGLLLCAKRVVYLPKGYYLYRMSPGSLSRAKRTPLQMVNLRLRPIINGVKWVDNVAGKLDFFKQNPQARHEILESVVRMFFKRSFEHSLKKRQHEIYEFIKQEFGEKMGDYDVLLAQLMTYINTRQKRIAKLEKQLKSK